MAISCSGNSRTKRGYPHGGEKGIPGDPIRPLGGMSSFDNELPFELIAPLYEVFSSMRSFAAFPMK